MELQLGNPDIKDRIKQKIKEVDLLAREMPGVVIIHNIRDLTVEYISPRGEQILGVTVEQLVEMGTQYYNRFFNHEETATQVPKMIGLLERNSDEELVALFQQVRRSEKHEWQWYCTSLRILMKDDSGKPVLTIAISIPIDPAHNLSNKVVRLLDENNFLRRNSTKFHKLTKMEKVVLTQIAIGKTSNEIAEAYFISSFTVDTHRKNIRRKLGIDTAYEFAEYARAFDLI